MPDIAPFCGLRYNSEGVNLSRVTSPPYDVISPEQRQQLLDRDPHNVVRLILGEGDSWHGQAAQWMQQWQQEGILRPDPQPAIYFYQHRFPLEGQEKVRCGFVALLRLADRSEKQVLPHERTFEGPKADRLKLTKACEANLEPIFLLVTDAEGRVRRVLAEAAQNLEAEVTDDKNVVHGIGRITHPEQIETLRDALQGQSVFVADGHHRYETSQNYRDYRRSLAPDDPPDAPYNYQMVYFCPVEDEGLHVLPTNRIVGALAEERLAPLDGRLSEYFTVESAQPASPEAFTATMREAGKTRQVIGFYRSGGKYTLLSPKPGVIEKYVGDESRSETWKHLDVSILHEIVLQRILGIAPDRLLDHVKYVREAAEGVRLVDQGQKQLAFLLNGTPADQVRRICLEGQHMPQKSTDFYPKLLSGLVFYKF